MTRARGIVLAATLCVSAVGAAQAASNAQFSATAIQSTPDGKTHEARLYVGDNQVRLEHDRSGSQVVEIYDMKHHRVMMIVPAQKVYMQRDLPDAPAANPMLPPKDSDPCTGVPGARCKKLGTETVAGRPVSKWEMTVEHQGKTLRSLHWIDDERHMSLRDVWPDGSVSEALMEGKEQLEGRSVEHWRMTISSPDGKKKMTSTQWYDPELQMAVREELPGGFYREIRDIHIAPQDPALFQVPKGYRRVESDNPVGMPGSNAPHTDNR